MNIELFIEENIDLIDSNNFTELYSRCVGSNRKKLTEVLYTCGIDPLLHMNEIPDMFAYKSSITDITIPDSVTSIGDWVFSYCLNLKSMALSNSVTSIGNYMFYKCTGLTSITIGSGVTSIGREAFWGCSNLTNITIPNSVTSIDEWAFAICTDLTSITIPSSVTSIGTRAFSYCENIQITYSGTKQEWKNLVTGKQIFPNTTYVCNCSDGTVKKLR